MSSFRPSFLHPPAVHPVNHRFFTPLFSLTSESLFLQLLCFHIYLRCPLLFSGSACRFSRATCTRSITNVFSMACSLFFSLCSFFCTRFLCFQSLAAFFGQKGGVPSQASAESQSATRFCGGSSAYLFSSSQRRSGSAPDFGGLLLDASPRYILGASLTMRFP